MCASRMVLVQSMSPAAPRKVSPPKITRWSPTSRSCLPLALPIENPMSMACELPLWFCSEELPTMSMLAPTLPMMAPPPALASSVVFAMAAHGASSARAARRKYFMGTSSLSFFSRESVLQPEDPLDVVLIKLLPVGLADRQLVRDLHLVGHELVGIVHRVHHPLDAEHRDAELDRRRPLHAAGRDPDVLAEVFTGFSK